MTNSVKNSSGAIPLFGSGIFCDQKLKACYANLAACLSELDAAEAKVKMHLKIDKQQREIKSEAGALSMKLEAQRMGGGASDEIMAGALAEIWGD